MNIVINILLVVGSLIVFLLIVGLLMKKKYEVRRDIIIGADTQKVFDYLRQLKNQDNFNKWVMVDPGMKRDFKGTDGTVGFIYGWNGNKRAGEGEQEIKKIIVGKSIDTEIRFVRPMLSVAYANLTTEPTTDKKTKVTWSNAGNMRYPMNVMSPMISNMLAKDMDTSLLNLKNILEK
jgi:hypothetical protein